MFGRFARTGAPWLLFGFLAYSGMWALSTHHPIGRAVLGLYTFAVSVGGAALLAELLKRG